MKIESHLHLNLKNISNQNLPIYLNQLEKCWLMSWEEKSPAIPETYKHLAINPIMEAYKKYPEKIVPFYAPDPKSENLKEKFAKFSEQGIKGCGELKVSYKWSDVIIEDYLKLINQFKLPLLFHMELPRFYFSYKSKSRIKKLFHQLFNGYINGLTNGFTSYYCKKISLLLPNKVKAEILKFPGYLQDFEGLEKRIKQFPKINFIGHGPHFWNNISNRFSPWQTHQKGKVRSFGIIDILLSKYKNFYCDISGSSGYNALKRDPKKAKIFIEKHSHKILFGTDNTTHDFDKLLKSFKLPQKKIQEIYYNNAKRLIP